MFIENKYTKVYYQIINRSRDMNRNKKEDYFERHHIVPKSMGGSNDKDNRVLLTPKEHYICHLLLTKMVNGINKQKMAYALWNLANVKGNKNQMRHKLSSRAYEMTRRIVQQNGRKEWPKEFKEKMRTTWINSLTSKSGEENGEFKGYFHTPWGKFASRREAFKKCPYKGFSSHRISKACKDYGMFDKIMRHRPITIPIEWVGKTYKELGFWFEEVHK